MRDGFPYFLIVLVVFAVIFGGIPWLRGWFEKPMENFLIWMACMVGLGLWIFYRWWRM